MSFVSFFHNPHDLRTVTVVNLIEPVLISRATYCTVRSQVRLPPDLPEVFSPIPEPDPGSGRGQAAY